MSVVSSVCLVCFSRGSFCVVFSGGPFGRGGGCVILLRGSSLVPLGLFVSVAACVGAWLGDRGRGFNTGRPCRSGRRPPCVGRRLGGVGGSERPPAGERSDPAGGRTGTPTAWRPWRWGTPAAERRVCTIQGTPACIHADFGRALKPLGGGNRHERRVDGRGRGQGERPRQRPVCDAAGGRWNVEPRRQPREGIGGGMEAAPASPPAAGMRGRGRAAPAPRASAGGTTGDGRGAAAGSDRGAGCAGDVTQ